jgi:DNA-binding CsgD family transcriptional regulator
MLRADDPRVLAIRVAADPITLTPELSTRLRRAAAERGYPTDAGLHLAAAATVVGDFESARVFLGDAVDGLREDGRLGLLPRMLSLQAVVAAFFADWATAAPATAELRQLATELGEPLYAAGADVAESLIAGMRGEEDAAERGAVGVERVGVPARVNALLAQGQFGRILAALGAGRPVAAFKAADRLFAPLDPAGHAMLAHWVIGDLAEAAVQADLVTHGRERLAQVESAVGPSPSDWIALNLRHPHAVLADDDEAAERFATALGADLPRWPFQRARLLLAQGRWLRRRRQITASRGPLRGARDGFDALGCPAWAGQARHELRASGERSRRPTPEVRDELTPQELQIAQLAAQGLSNREIGQRLYLSHRTVSTHLYRVFPKLGITSRGELGDALAQVSRVTGRPDPSPQPGAPRRRTR